MGLMEIRSRVGLKRVKSTSDQIAWLETLTLFWPYVRNRFVVGVLHRCNMGQYFNPLMSSGQPTSRSGAWFQTRVASLPAATFEGLSRELSIYVK